MDPLAISRGSNEGAAAVLGRSNFEDFTRSILQLRENEIQRDNKNSAAAIKILNDDVKAKWTEDAVKYFEPKKEEIRNYTIDLFKKKNGKLSEMDVFEIENKWNRLKGEVELSNQLYAEEQERLKQLQEDPKGLKYNTRASFEFRQAYSNPWSNPETAQEIEKAGGIIPWRAQNRLKFENVGAYNVDNDIQESFKDKIGVVYKKDKSGKVSWTDRGDFVETIGQKMVDPEKLETHYNTFWKRDNLAGTEFRNQAYDWAKNNFDVDAKGNIIPLTKEALQITPPSTKGKTQNQILAELAYNYGKKQIESTTKSEEVLVTRNKRDVNNINVNNNSGGGPLFDFNWTTGKGYSGPSGMEWESNPQFETYMATGNFTKEQALRRLDDLYKKRFGIPQAPFVTVTAKKADNNPVIQVTDKKGGVVNAGTAGFYKDPVTRSWIWVGSEEIGKDGNINIYTSTLKTDQDGGKQPKKEFSKVTKDITKDKEIATQIASRYGFTTLNDFYSFLEKKIANKTVLK